MEIQSYIYEAEGKPEEVLANIGRYQMSRANLACFKAGKCLPEIVVDACLKCIKKKNSVLRKKGKVKESMYCLTTKFCKALFQSQSPLPNRLKKNLLGYE